MKKDLGAAPLTIGGWLFLVALRLILGIANNGNGVLQTFGLQLNTQGQIIRILSALPVIFAFVVLALLLKRHKAFPIAYIMFESFVIFLNLFSFFIVAVDLSAIKWDAFENLQVIIATIIGSLWILYMLLSKRVKKTFVYGWRETLDQRLADKANST